MGKLNFIARLKTLTTKILVMISNEVGQWIDDAGEVTEVEEENRSDNVIPIDTASDVIDIAEDLAAYYYLAKRLRKVQKEDIREELQTEFDALNTEIWTKYGLDQAGIDDAREYVSEFMQNKDVIENWLEALF